MSWTKAINPTVDGFTKALNPTSGSVSITQGSPIGLLLALTYSTTTSVMSVTWTNALNPVVDNWTKVTNPT